MMFSSFMIVLRVISVHIHDIIKDDTEYAPDSTGNNNSMSSDYLKLKDVRSRLIDQYNSEFMNTLLKQATNSCKRYKPVHHVPLQTGDIILLKENYTKAYDYPLAIVTDVKKNDIGEVTGETAKKGKTRETVKRHVISVIPLLRRNTPPANHATPIKHVAKNIRKSTRAASALSRNKTKALFESHDA